MSELQEKAKRLYELEQACQQLEAELIATMPPMSTVTFEVDGVTHAYWCGVLPIVLTHYVVDEGKSQFAEHLERASSIVASWPAWKREVLG